jgi:hypothetical protein
MAVSFATISRVNPGRTLDAVALASSAAKLVERHGGHTPRLLASDVLGEQVSMMIFAAEFDTLAAYGAFADESAADSEIQSIIDRATGPQSPVTLLAQQLAADVPIGRTMAAGRGNVIEVYLMRVGTGGLQSFLDATQRWCHLVEGHGAVATRLLTIVHGGSQTGLYASVAEYPDHQTWGQATDAWTNTAEGQQLAADLASGAIPAQITSSGLYVEIPI